MDAKADEEIPLMTFRGLNQTGVKNGHIQYTMTAGRSDVFAQRKETELNDFTFQEYDSNGKPASRGSATRAVVNTVTNDAHLTGRLEAHDAPLGVHLTIDAGPSGGLNWSNENRLLTTAADARVSVAKDDGSVIQAKGLTLDLWSNRLTLENGIDGQWTPEEKHENPAGSSDSSDQSGPPPSR